MDMNNTDTDEQRYKVVNSQRSCSQYWLEFSRLLGAYKKKGLEANCCIQFKANKCSHDVCLRWCWSEGLRQVETLQGVSAASSLLRPARDRHHGRVELPNTTLNIVGVRLDTTLRYSRVLFLLRMKDTRGPRTSVRSKKMR
jgi:hypothetical protein